MEVVVKKEQTGLINFPSSRAKEDGTHVVLWMITDCLLAADV